MQKSWVSRCFIPCPGIDRCEFYKPGEPNHPQQHMVEQVINENGSSYSSRSGSISSSSTQSNKRIVMSGTFLENLAPVPFDPNLDPPSFKNCFNCWRTNHLLKDCKLRKRNKFCSNCGRKYVEVEDCPRCSKAYYEHIEEEDHIRAKIELYGDPDYHDSHEKRKEDEVKPAKDKNSCTESVTTGKKDNFWIGRSNTNVSQKNTALSNETAGLVFTKSEGSECDYKSKSNNTSATTSFVNEFKSMNLNVKEKEERKAFLSSHYKDPNKKAESYTKSTNSLATSKFDSSQSDSSKDLKKAESVPLEASSLEKQLDDSDEDLENVIFDEEADEDTAQNVTEDFVIGEDNLEAYRNLLSRIKNLPQEAQNVAIRLFINTQKRLNQ